MTSRAMASRRARYAKALLAHVLESGEFRQLAAEAAAATAAAHSQISMLTDRQIASAVYGHGPTPGTSIAFDDSICANVLRAGTTLVIDDATLEPRTASLAGVEKGRVGSYLGSPIRVGPNQEIVGVLCVYDAKSRHWTEEEIARVQSLAEQASRRLEAVHQPER